MTTMTATTNDDLGKLILRVLVGGLIVFHGLALATGDAGIPNNLARWGLPTQLMWVGFLIEFVGGIGMIVGAYARLGGLLLGLFMVVALIMAHAGLIHHRISMVLMKPHFRKRSQIIIHSVALII